MTVVSKWTLSRVTCIGQTPFHNDASYPGFHSEILSRGGGGGGGGEVYGVGGVQTAWGGG